MSSKGICEVTCRSPADMAKYPTNETPPNHPRSSDKRVPLYMAFPDGVYHYVCAECTALCCRGQGFGGSFRREMGQLLSLYPALGSMAVSRQGDIISFATPTGGCHFLDGDNLCRIEKEHGKQLKPGVCTLFPFNVFTRIGKTIAVSPHFMCPLRLRVPARPGEVEGTHSAVETAVRESALLDGDQVKNHAQSATLHPSLNAEEVLARESRFRDRCSAALGRRRFYTTVRGESEDAPSFDEFIPRALKVMGYEGPPRPRRRDGIDDLMLALAPPLRLTMLTSSSEAMLRALALGEMLLRWVAPLSSGPPTLQGAHHIITSFGGAIRLLASGDQPVQLRARAAKVAPFGDPDMTFAAFRVLRDVASSTAPLVALEKAVSPALTVSQRSVLLVQLGSQISHGTVAAKKRT